MVVMAIVMVGRDREVGLLIDGEKLLLLVALLVIVGPVDAAELFIKGKHFPTMNNDFINWQF